MRRHILLPTDFSENAWSAARYAMHLYAEKECTFYFIHSTQIKVATMSNLSNKLLEVMTKNDTDELYELKKKAENSRTNSSHRFEIALSHEDLLSAIERAINTFNIDLVVMGTKGVTKASDIFFGSNTVQIIKKLKQCPVLAVPDDFDFVTPEEIAFPTGFERFYGDELTPIKQLSELHGSKIRIVHIDDEDNLSESQSYNLAMLKAYMEDYPHQFHWIQEYDQKSNGINEFIDEFDINILAMINYKHSLMERIVNEPVIKKIGFHPKIPFLVIPA